MAATVAAQLPTAWINLKMINVLISFACMHTKVATRYKTSPAYNGFFRPYRSSRGPYNNCPSEIPTKKLDSDNATVATEVPRLLAISPNPGRYMSMEKGANAVNDPKMRT
jgi:hypothetical protein